MSNCCKIRNGLLCGIVAALLLTMSCASDRQCRLGYTCSSPFYSLGSLWWFPYLSPDDLSEMASASYGMYGGTGPTDYVTLEKSIISFGMLNMKPPKPGPDVMTHSHTKVKDYRDAKFCIEGYVSECDIEEMRLTLQDVTVRNLKSMLACMCRPGFEYHQFTRRYAPFVASSLLEKVQSVSRADSYTDLGGWQMFKPGQGLDADSVTYRLGRDSTGSYRFSTPDYSDVVRLDIKYAGKYLNPVIVRVRNENKGIDVCGSGCDHSVRTKMLAYSKYDQEYMFLKFLAPFLYDESQPDKFITDEDFCKFKDKVNALKLAFVNEFYRHVSESGGDIRKIQKKYRYSMAHRFAAMTDSLVRAKDYSADMFLPCSYSDFAANNHTVTYLGDDWYQISAAGKSLTLKVVLYGKQLTPAIMGMRNPSQNIDYCPDRFTWLDGNK
jgi:hypothetical protein